MERALRSRAVLWVVQLAAGRGLGDHPPLSFCTESRCRLSTVGLDSTGREETGCHSEHADHGKERALLSPVVSEQLRKFAGEWRPFRYLLGALTLYFIWPSSQTQERK